MTLKTPALSVPPITDYQALLVEKITELRASGLNYKQIARVLKREGYQTPRGKAFTAKHIWSMRKKHGARQARLDHKPQLDYGPLCIEYVDHSPTYLKKAE